MIVNDSQKYIMLIGAATLLAGFSLASLMIYTDPNEVGWIVYSLVYLSLFLASLGIFTLIGLLVRKIWFSGLFNSKLSASFRQSLFLSGLLVLCAILSAHGLLFWWVTLSLVLPVLAVEAFLNLKI
jgi:hypothetical protein